MLCVSAVSEIMRWLFSNHASLCFDTILSYLDKSSKALYFLPYVFACN